MAKADGIVQGIDKGSVFIGQVTLSGDGELATQAALLRKALSLKGGSGLRMEFHEGAKDTVVIARIATVK